MADAPPSRQSERAPDRPSERQSGYQGNGFNPIVGDRVAVGAPPGSLGWVRFLGPTSFSTGEWFGIELDDPAGKNDGSVKGERYFDCKDKHGLFVRRPHIRKPEVKADKGDGRSSLIKAYDALEAQPKEGALPPPSPTSPESEAASPSGIAAPKARLSLTKSKAPAAPRRDSLNGVPPAKATPAAPSPAAKPTAEKRESVSILKKGGALLVGRQEEERRRSSVGRPKSAAPPSEEQRRNSQQRTLSATPTSTKEDSVEETGREVRSSPSVVDRSDPEHKNHVGGRYSSPIRNRNSASPKPNAQAILRANSREDQVRELRRELAEAMEDHDVHRLRGLLPAAESAGVEVNELEHARRIIDTSMQQEVMKEIELVREAVSDLASLVQMVEGRASQLTVHYGRTSTNSRLAEDDSATSQASDPTPPAVVFDETIIKAFLDELGERIQTELRSTIKLQLEEVVTKQVRQHVAQATQEVSELAKEVRDLSAAALTGKSSDTPLRTVPSDTMKGVTTLMTEEEAGFQKEMAEDPKSRMSVWNANAKEDMAMVLPDVPSEEEDMAMVLPDVPSEEANEDIPVVLPDVPSEEVAAATKIQASFRGNQVRKMQTKDNVGDKSETQVEASAPTPAPDPGSVVITCRSCNNTGMDFFGGKCPCPYGAGAQAPAPTAEVPAPIPIPEDPYFELKNHDGYYTDNETEVIAAATKIQASFRGNQVRKTQTKDQIGSKSENEAEPPAPPPGGNDKSEDKENEKVEGKEVEKSEGKENEKPEDKENDKSKDKALAPVSPDQAATQLQATIRGKNDRRMLKRREAAARTIQRVWRGEYTRRVVKDRVDSHRFAAAVVKASRRHANWLEIFEDLATEQPSEKGTQVGLEFRSFREALKQVHPQISGAQAEVLFQGYTQGVGSTSIDLTGFIDIAEAVSRGNREAGEFAEISGDAFAELAGLETVGCSFDKLLPGASPQASNEEGEEAKAATAIQAKWRGNQVRKKTIEMQDEAEKAKDMDEDKAEKPKDMDEETAATQIQARWKGKQVRKQMTKDNNSEEPKASSDPVKVPTSMDAEYYRVHFATCPPTLWSSLHQHFPSAGGSQVSQDANAPTGSAEEDANAPTGSAEEEAAAARIQANWKGKQVRREFAEQEKVAKEEAKRTTLALWATSSTKELLKEFETGLPQTDDSTSPDKALQQEGDDNDENDENDGNDDFDAFRKLPSVATWYIALPLDLESPAGALAIGRKELQDDPEASGAQAISSNEIQDVKGCDPEAKGAQAISSNEIQDVKRCDPEAKVQWNLLPSVGSWCSARKGACRLPSPAVPRPEEGISPLPVEGSVPSAPMVLLNVRSPCDHSPGMDDFLRFI